MLVARPSPSVLRAAVMARDRAGLAGDRPAAAGGAGAGRGDAGAARSGIPTLASDAGFAHVGAGDGCAAVARAGLGGALRRRHVPAGDRRGGGDRRGAHLVTAPVIAAISGRVSLVAMPGERARRTGGRAGDSARASRRRRSRPWWLGAARGVRAAGRLAVPLAGRGWPTTSVRCRVPPCRGRAGCPAGSRCSPSPVGLVLLVRRAGLTRLAGGCRAARPAGADPGAARGSRVAAAGWEMVACDVGQGDALVLSRRAGGGGRDRCRARRRCRSTRACAICTSTRSPLLVFTHYHLDHVGGIAGVLHDRPGRARHRRAAARPGERRRAGARRACAARAGRDHSRCRARRSPSGRAAGRARPADAFHGTPLGPEQLLARAAGDHRCAARASCCPATPRSRPSDALLDAGTDLRADVLKVPHHGSAYSDPAFLAAVHARVGVISVGAAQRLRPPVARCCCSELARLGVPVRRTDQDGDVAVVGSGAGLATVVRHEHRVSRHGRPPVLAERPDGARRARRCAVPGWAHASPGSSSRSASTSCPTRCRRSSCSSVTRNCSSAAPSARSPPCCAAPSPRIETDRARRREIDGRSCTNCSGPRCSASRGWSSSAAAQDVRTAALAVLAPYLEHAGRRHDDRACTTPAARRARPCSRPRARPVRSRSRAPS